MRIRLCAALAASLLSISGCSLIPDSLRPASRADVAAEPAGFVEAGDCRARPSVASAPERPKGVSQKQGGWVALEFNLFGPGKPSNVRVVEASPKGVFEQSAIEAMSHSTFVPITDRAIGCRYILEYQGG